MKLRGARICKNAFDDAGRVVTSEPAILSAPDGMAVSLLPSFWQQPESASPAPAPPPRTIELEAPTLPFP